MQPPRQRLEEALLDVISASTRPDRVVDLVLRAGQRRLTTADRLRVAADERPRLRWRGLVKAMCAELGGGALEEAFRDRRRDNRATRAGDLALRYGWREVVGALCEVAAEVAEVMHGQGWAGRPRPCGARLPPARSQREVFLPLSGNKSSRW